MPKKTDPDSDQESASPTMLVEARQLTAGYASGPVIKELNLAVGAGEIVAILGPNGAGKTTTMRVLSGALKPMSGQLLIRGHRTSEGMSARVRQGLAVIPEEGSVIQSLTCEQNLRLGRGSVQAALEIMPELKQLLRRRANVLSGGEQRFITIARALAPKPFLLLADELSLGLAPIVFQRILESLAQARQAGVGVIIVEQYVHQVLKIVDRAYVIRRGEIVMQGTGAELARSQRSVEDMYLS